MAYLPKVVKGHTTPGYGIDGMVIDDYPTVLKLSRLYIVTLEA